MKKLVKFGIVAVTLLLVGTGCSKGDAKAKSETQKETTVKLGVIGSDTDVWDNVKDRLKKEGVNLEYVKFTDYNQPNAALADKSIDLNSFQHQFFLDNYNKEHKTN